MKESQNLPAWHYIVLLVILTAGIIGIIFSWPIFLLILLTILAVVLAWLYLPFILIFLPAVLPYLPAINPTADIDLASGRLVIALLAVIGSIYIVYTRKSWFNLSTPTILILFLLSWALFSGFVAEDPGRFIRKYLVFLTIFPIYFLSLAFLQKRKQWGKLFAYWSWSALLVSLIGLGQFLFQFAGGKERFFAYWGKFVAPILYGTNAGEAVASNPSWLVNISGVDVLRAIGTFPDPHMLAFYLGMSIPIQVTYVLNRTPLSSPPLPVIPTEAEESLEQPERDPFASALRAPLRVTTAVLWILPILSLLVLLLTFSRGSYVGLAGVAIWLLFYVLKKGIDSIFVYRAIFVMFVAILAIFSISPIRDRFTSILDFNEGSNKGRLETWSEAIDVIKYNPILGVGLGNYSNFVRPEADFREPIYAHNTYLDLASETGIPGTIAWILLLFWGITPLWRNDSNKFNLAATLGIFWFSLHSLFETPIFSPQILPLILVLLAYRTYIESKMENEKIKK
ncbi:MAG: O-antigen ligase family protein [Candidatus Moraniibacteriota bacterium]